MTPSLSWSDVLILSVIIIYIIKYIFSQEAKPEKALHYVNNNNGTLSSNTNCITVLLHRITGSFKIMIFSARSETFFLKLFMIWMAISIFWAPLQLIAAYRLLIILLIVNFSIIIRNQAKKGYIKAEFIYLGLFMGGIIQSLIGILQFILNRSLGFKFFGESLLGPDIPGVAKIVVSGMKHIRAYGTFPHPNILAGFLVLQIILLISVLVKRQIQNKRGDKNVPHETILSKIPTWLFISVLVINLSSFFLTFSRSAFLSIFLAGLALLIVNIRLIRNRILLIFTTFIILLLLGYILASLNLNYSLYSTQSLEERVLFLNVSRETISEHPWLGVGLGQFIYQEIISQPSWAGWQYQPVHNIYLLITSELGMTGLMFFLLYLLTLLYNCCFMRIKSVLLTNYPYCIIILCYLFISFFDHYFWDIKPGIIIFAIPFILSQISFPYGEKNEA